MRHRTSPLHALATLALLLTGCEPAATPVRDPVVVYVVRHAERADDGAGLDGATTDPPLAEAGRARAAHLAELLGSAGLTHVHSTDLLRTRSTALPVSEAEGLELEIYDPADPARLAARLRATPGTHLVVGHSNTAPALVRALGGDPGSPIDPLEYDRIYVLHLLADGSARSALFRYGEPPGTR